MNQKKFKIEKIAISQKFSMRLKNDDFARDLITAELEASFLASTVNEKTITHYFPKPTFMDWLMGRTIKVEIKATVKDIMLDPPKDNELRTYIFEKL